MDGAVEDLTLVLAGIPQFVLLLQVLHAEARREEELWHDKRHILLQIIRIILLERTKVEERGGLGQGLDTRDQRCL